MGESVVTGCLGVAVGSGWGVVGGATAAPPLTCECVVWWWAAFVCVLCPCVVGPWGLVEVALGGGPIVSVPEAGVPVFRAPVFAVPAFDVPAFDVPAFAVPVDGLPSTVLGATPRVMVAPWGLVPLSPVADFVFAGCWPAGTGQCRR
ncbi:MAG: hypothetical protein WAU75_09605, partial [Solirubrobacteraceae bacterium]